MEQLDAMTARAHLRAIEVAGFYQPVKKGQQRTRQREAQRRIDDLRRIADRANYITERDEDAEFETIETSRGSVRRPRKGTNRERWGAAMGMFATSKLGVKVARGREAIRTIFEKRAKR